MSAKPWVRQFELDLLELARGVEQCRWVEGDHRNFRDLFLDIDTKEQFLMEDCARLLLVCWTVCVPPPGYEPPSVPLTLTLSVRSFRKCAR